MGQIIHELQDLRHLEWARIRHSSGTAGSFLKSYSDSHGVRTYYKLSDYDSTRGIVGHECVNEVIVDRLLTMLKIDHLDYTLQHALITLDGRELTTWLCSSTDFKQRGERKITLENLYQAMRQEDETPLAFCKRMDWQEYIYEMLIVDYLILNRDRHGANIEFLQDVKRKAYRPAPLFDHGLSLVCRCQTEESLRGIQVMEDKKVQSFVGGNSAAENLLLVPKKSMRRIPALPQDAGNILMDGLQDILTKRHRDVILKMIRKRWEYFEDLRHS